MSADDERGRPRQLVVEQAVDAPPEAVWRALTDPHELRRWFPLDASVEPGVGGRVWLSWGPGVEGAAPIHAWDPPRRFGWTESHGSDEAGRPVRLAVDFHVEGRAGVTVVRLVQSGFGPASDWDETYDALRDGWTYFLFNLAFYLSHHGGEPRHMVWRRVPTDLARDAAWRAVLGGGPRVTGLGGAFFKARDPEALSAWYGEHLGIAPELTGQSFEGETVAFAWRHLDDPSRAGHTVWGPFPADTRYFEPSAEPFMFNYRVDDLDGLLERLRAADVEVDDRIESYEYGRFAWIMAPEGNRIELWEPAGGV